MVVHLFVPCFIDQFFPETAWNTVKVLEKAGCHVAYNVAQTCCGQAAFNAGFWEEATTVAQKCINDSITQHIDYIVSPSASCVAFMKNYYKKLKLNQQPLKNYDILSDKVYELTDFLINILGKDTLGSHFKAVATYHDACSALRECGIKQAPRQLLANVSGLKLEETSSCEECCGFGGTFAVKFEAISTAMAAEKVKNIQQNKNIKYIISTDSSCLMHLDSYLKKQEHALKVMHIADVLAQGL